MSQAGTRINKPSTVEWVRVSDLKVSDLAQRRLSMAWVNAHVPIFNPDALGFIVVNRRQTGDYYVIDGQHREELLKAVGWGDQKIQCELYAGLTLREEAAEFLRRNDRRSVQPFDEFRVRITAEEPVANAIVRILQGEGLRLAMGDGPGKVHAVAALENVFTAHDGKLGDQKAGARALWATLVTLKAAFGLESPSFLGHLVEGLGLVFLRHADLVDRSALTKKLAKVSGGPAGLMGRARAVREIKGRSLPHCAASVVVDEYNKGRRDKLPDWWS